jgi:hypothetical protein
VQVSNWKVFIIIIYVLVIAQWLCYSRCKTEDIQQRLFAFEISAVINTLVLLPESSDSATGINSSNSINMTLAGSFAMFANMNALIFILVAGIEEISKAALFVNSASQTFSKCDSRVMSCACLYIFRILTYRRIFCDTGSRKCSL